MQAIYQREMSKQNYSKQGIIPAAGNQPAQQYQMNFQVGQNQQNQVSQQTQAAILSTRFIRNAKTFLVKLSENPLDNNSKELLNILIQSPEYNLQQSSIYPLINKLQGIYKELQLDQNNTNLIEEAKKILIRLSEMA